MIATIQGTVSFHADDHIIINVGGIGYAVFIACPPNSPFPPLNESLFLHTYHHIREDIQMLYGFKTIEEKQFFGLLTSVSGIGPKLGIKVLSQGSVAEIASAITQQNMPFLTSLPGIGKKVAERIMVELGDKCVEFCHSEGATSTPAPLKVSPQGHDELILAMKSLGYSQAEINTSISNVKSQLDPNAPLEENLKRVLASSV